MAVFVPDKQKKPLMPCSEKRARLLWERGRAVVHRMGPFTIRLKDRQVEHSVLQPVRLKLDPGSQTTGTALMREVETANIDTGAVLRSVTVLMVLELTHQGSAIRDALMQRRVRRSRPRYRPARFDNRTRPPGWLAPSRQHWGDTTLAWVQRLRHWAPISALSQELVRFDVQQLHNPEIRGVEDRPGTPLGYAVREYLLKKWRRTGVYGGATDVPLEIAPLTPKSPGGSNRGSNLALACHGCNQAKGAQTAAECEFPHLHVHSTDGYSWTQIASKRREEERATGAAHTAALSLLGLNAEVSRAN